MDLKPLVQVVKSVIKFNMDHINCNTLIERFNQIVRQDLPTAKPCWLPLISNYILILSVISFQLIPYQWIHFQPLTLVSKLMWNSIMNGHFSQQNPLKSDEWSIQFNLMRPDLKFIYCVRMFHQINCFNTSNKSIFNTFIANLFHPIYMKSLTTSPVHLL